MDDRTKTMMLTLLSGVIKKGLLVAGTGLASHGIINSNQTETFVAIGMALVSAGYSFYQDYGKAILLSQLEVLKAKSLAQAAKMRQAGVAPPTASEIAEQHPTLTPTDIVKGTTALILAVVLAGLFAGDARAQQPRLTGNIVKDIQAANPTRPNLTGSPLNDIIGALDAKLLPDLQYALKLADASGSKVTGPCYKAWIDIINTRQKAVQGADGTDMPMPEPHIVTEFEKLVELRNSLQPESEFMIKCSPVSSMVKKDIVGFIGLVLSGGAGLATLVPGL